ncbi:hypothetical protein C8Q75DRAFT_430290 [Abortiporus biennis]|nr:hypothetical protein C8Q75DRAFT_430290 [Abortiporus biennis]
MSSSPQWDNRNQGFISPARLQQWNKQHPANAHEFQSRSDISSPPPQQQPPSLPEMQRTSSRQSTGSQGTPQRTHGRGLSAFSLFKHRNSHSQDTSRPNSVDSTNKRNVLTRRPTNSETPPQTPPIEKDKHDANQPPMEEKPIPRPISIAGPPPAPPPIQPESLHPEIRSIVGLTLAHQRKIYYSGPMVRKVERQPDGQKHTKDGGWRKVWAQLGGTSLSIWDMKEIEEASKQGKQVPPQYINITDAFVQAVGNISIPTNSPATPPEKYSHVFSLNTAGLNLLLFSCPSPEVMIGWISALRLAAWEKSRLEEIYTAHLIRITMNGGRDVPTTLTKGHMEGWVRVRLAGQTDWKLLWMVISAGSGSQPDAASTTLVDNTTGGSATATRKRRMSNFFGMDKSPTRRDSFGSPARPIIHFYNSQKNKDKKKPVITFYNLLQAFAVYPERPEFISRSTLMKLEGTFGDEEAVGTMINREGWLLVMPELEGGNTRASEMLKWLIGIHDAFELYGRPRPYSWDPRDPRSMMFAYPIGPNKDLLFLDPKLSESLDPRDDRTSSIRGRFQQILWSRMREPNLEKAAPPLPGDQPPLLPPIPSVSSQESSTRSATGALQLPPLEFEREQPQPSDAPRSLSPIKEQSVQWNHSRSGSDPATSLRLPLHQSVPIPIPDKSPESPSILGGSLTTSPIQTASSPPPDGDTRIRKSEDSYRVSTVSRPDSKLSQLTASKQQPATPPPTQPVASESANVKLPTSPVPETAGLSHSPSPITQTVQRAASPKVAHPTQSLPPSSPPQQSPQPVASTQSPPSTTTQIKPTEADRRDSIDSFAHTLPSPKPPPSTFTRTNSTEDRQSLTSLSQPLPSPRQVTAPGFHRLNSVDSDRHSLTSLSQPLPSPRAPEGPPSAFNRPSSRSASVLTSPHSIRDTTGARPSSPQFSVMTSPHSIRDSAGIRPPSPQFSVMTSPHSIRDSGGVRPASPQFSVMTSPHSVMDQQGISRMMAQGPSQQGPSSPRPGTIRTITSRVDQPLPSPIRATAPQTPHSPLNSSPLPPPVPLKDDNIEGLMGEAGAMYYMRHIEKDAPRRPPPPPDTDEDEEESTDSESVYTPPPRMQNTSPLRIKPHSPSTSPTFVSSKLAMQNVYEKLPSGLNKGTPSPEMAGGRTPSRFGTVGKPSGARAAPTNKMSSASAGLSRPVVQQQPPSPLTDDEEDMSDDEQPRAIAPTASAPSYRHVDDNQLDEHADALAALTFLEREDVPQQSSQSQHGTLPPPQPIPEVLEPMPSAPSQQASAGIRSSFAPSKQAAERKAKSQAQQAAYQAAVHKPGRANGKSRAKRNSRMWGESSDEEEEEEEEEEEDDDEDVDSDVEPERPLRGRSEQPVGARGPGPASNSGPSTGPSPGGSTTDLNAFGRRPRDLPQLPGQMGPMSTMGSDDRLGPQTRRMVSDQYPQQPSMYGDISRRGQSPQPPMRSQPEYQQPAPPRQPQSIWNQVLDPNQKPQSEPRHDTFVQIEPPSQTMTKAFAPHGLLSAGLQDKHDRSAKRQEELARETGASLINVPNKPPPPQTGLLGAVTAHERERKRDGGLGATLTEREREKRLAEERQRKMDELQRMQLEQMQNGSMYGGMGMPQMGFNPMMANPMMMNPMMTGWGYPGMMNPQHMFAAQQAAQAYQQAMMAFSTAGSQMGGDGAGGQPPMNPMMTGGGMGMNNFDPRMSMMGMPMMNTGMGMNPAMGMGMGMGGLSPMGGMGMQMTGGSAFDARYSPGYDAAGGLQPPSEVGAQGAQQRTLSSQNNSPNGQGSPLASTPVNGEEPPRRSANGSPNPNVR